MFPPRVSAAAQSDHCSREMPTTFQVLPGGRFSAAKARCFVVALMPPTTPITSEKSRGPFKSPMSTKASAEDAWPVSKHSSSGFTPASFIMVMRYWMSSKRFSKTKLNTQLSSLGVVLRVVHRAHVEGADLGLVVGDVRRLAALGVDGPRREVQDDRAHRADRVADGAVARGGVVGRAVVGAGVDVEHARPGLPRALRLAGEVVDGVGDRGALRARGDHAAHRAGDDDLVVRAHGGARGVQPESGAARGPRKPREPHGRGLERGGGGGVRSPFFWGRRP